MKKVVAVFSLLAAVSISACKPSAQPPADSTDLPVTNTPAGGSAAPAANAANVNAVPAKTPENPPRRVSFARGANTGSVSFTVAAGMSQRLIIGARSGQTMEVESSSRELQISLVKGRAETTDDLGFLHAELESTGDFVVEIRNPTKKELKATVRVTVNGGDPKSDPTYDEPIPDGAGDAPEPSGRSVDNRRVH